MTHISNSITRLMNHDSDAAHVHNPNLYKIGRFFKNLFAKLSGKPALPTLEEKNNDKAKLVIDVAKAVYSKLPNSLEHYNLTPMLKDGKELELYKNDKDKYGIYCSAKKSMFNDKYVLKIYSRTLDGIKEDYAKLDNTDELLKYQHLIHNTLNLTITNKSVEKSGEHIDSTPDHNNKEKFSSNSKRKRI